LTTDRPFFSQQPPSSDFHPAEEEHEVLASRPSIKALLRDPTAVKVM